MDIEFIFIDFLDNLPTPQSAVFELHKLRNLVNVPRGKRKKKRKACDFFFFLIYFFFIWCLLLSIRFFFLVCRCCLDDSRGTCVCVIPMNEWSWCEIRFTCWRNISPHIQTKHYVTTRPGEPSHHLPSLPVDVLIRPTPPHIVFTNNNKKGVSRGNHFHNGLFIQKYALFQSK